MDSEVRTYRTGGEEVVLDLTRDADRFVESRGDGLLHVFVPHATAGLAIIETGAGSDDDLLAVLADLLPADDRWQHRHGSRGQAGPMSCQPSWRHTAACPCWTAGSRSAPGRASAWSTSTSTTPSGRSGSAS